MAAVRMRLRAVAGREWLSTAVLLALVVLASTVVLTGAAGARRTADSYDRFLAQSRSSDVYLFPGSATARQVRAIAGLPQVADMGTAQTFDGQLADGTFFTS